MDPNRWRWLCCYAASHTAPSCCVYQAQPIHSAIGMVPVHGISLATHTHTHPGHNLESDQPLERERTWCGSHSPPAPFLPIPTLLLRVPGPSTPRVCVYLYVCHKSRKRIGNGFHPVGWRADVKPIPANDVSFVLVIFRPAGPNPDAERRADRHTRIHGGTCSWTGGTSGECVIKSIECQISDSFQLCA